MRRKRIDNLEIERFLDKEIAQRFDLHRYLDLGDNYNRPLQKVAARELATLKEIRYRILGSFGEGDLSKIETKSAAQEGIRNLRRRARPEQPSLPIEDPKGGRKEKP